MRNTILALITVGSLTFAAPAFAARSCYPCLDSSPIQGAFDSSPARGLSYQMRGESYQVPPAHTRHARRYHSSYRYTG
jgi:hypothetical protein